MLQDIRHSLRMMRRAPAFTAAVVLTVALAIAANTTIFSVVYAVMLRPLPFAEPDRLVQIAEKNDKLNLPAFGASVLNFLSWREETQAFDGIAAVGFSNYTLSGVGEPEQLTGNRISPALTHLLGVAPIVGRAFTDDEEKPGAGSVAMIGEGLWKRRFGSDPTIIGRTVTLNDTMTTIVGIMPSSLNLFSGADVYTPLTIDPSKEIRLNHVILVAGRLKQGVSLQQAQADMDGVSVHVGQQYPEVRDWGIHLLTFFDTFVSPQLQTGLLMLLSAVAFVLLIACANIANLLLARATARQKEIALRNAIGAARGRIIRQLLTESILLSLTGGLAGVVATYWSLHAIVATLPPNTLPVSGIQMNALVMVFAVVLTIAMGLLFGVAPAWRIANMDLNDALKQTGRGAASGAGSRLRNILSGAEIALATVLLIGAGLLIRSFANLERVRLGFESRGLITFQLSPPPAKYPTNATTAVLYRALIDALQSLPGVRSAAVSSGIPFGNGTYSTHPMASTGASVLPPGTLVPIDWRIVSPGYFATMKVPLLRGRDFTDADGTAAPVMIVSQSTAKKFWGDADPIGRVLRRSADLNTSFTVIGVVGDVRSTALNQESPALYYPMSWRTWPLMDVVARTDGAPKALLPGIRQKIHELDAELALANVRTMDEWISNSAAQPRLNAALLGAFAAGALLLAAIGIYGVLSYSVSQRTQEIGLRMALGELPAGVLRLVIGEGLKVGVTGIAIGVAGGLALGRTVSSLVYGVAVYDPVTFIGVASLLLTVALAACAIPARRAARVDPLIALRHD